MDRAPEGLSSDSDVASCIEGCRSSGHGTLSLACSWPQVPPWGSLSASSRVTGTQTQGCTPPAPGASTLRPLPAAPSPCPLCSVMMSFQGSVQAQNSSLEHQASAPLHPTAKGTCRCRGNVWGGNEAVQRHREFSAPQTTPGEDKARVGTGRAWRRGLPPPPSSFSCWRAAVRPQQTERRQPLPA